MAKEKFERTKPHVNIGTIGHVLPEDVDRLLVALEQSMYWNGKQHAS